MFPTSTRRRITIKIHINGDAKDVKATNNTIEGDGSIDNSTGGVQMFRWAMIGLVGLALIVGLAWGANGFRFSGLGMDADSGEESDADN